MKNNNQEEQKSSIEEKQAIVREKLKQLRYLQYARIYDAKTERINSWFRYHR